MSRRKRAQERAERLNKRQEERRRKADKQKHDPAKWEAKKAARDKAKLEN